MWHCLKKLPNYFLVTKRLMSHACKQGGCFDPVFEMCTLDQVISYGVNSFTVKLSGFLLISTANSVNVY